MSQTGETKLWNRIKKIKENAHFTRVESNTSNGIPDVHCVLNNRVFWLELKANDLKNRGISKWQINWHIKYQRAGGKVYILNSPLKQRALEILVVNRDSRCVDLVATSSVTTTQGIWDLLLKTAGAAS
jgi:hypothetical protein|tara:strand:- start:145 stop:528 length:384 start_codon:yes stop_codon:yes gene_type:complete